MLSKISVKKPMTVLVAVVLVLVLGIVSFFKMTPDLLPNMDFPYAVIMTTYAGQTPEAKQRFQSLLYSRCRQLTVLRRSPLPHRTTIHF